MKTNLMSQQIISIIWTAYEPNQKYPKEKPNTFKDKPWLTAMEWYKNYLHVTPHIQAHNFEIWTYFELIINEN